VLHQYGIGTLPSNRRQERAKGDYAVEAQRKWEANRQVPSEDGSDGLKRVKGEGGRSKKKKRSAGGKEARANFTSAMRKIGRPKVRGESPENSRLKRRRKKVGPDEHKLHRKPREGRWEAKRRKQMPRKKRRRAGRARNYTLPHQGELGHQEEKKAPEVLDRGHQRKRTKNIASQKKTSRNH